jgi:hypothetical protein
MSNPVLNVVSVDTSPLTDIQTAVLAVITALVAVVAAIGIAVLGFQVGKAAWFRFGPAISKKIAGSAA